MEVFETLVHPTPVLQAELGHSHYDDVRRRVVSALSSNGEQGERTPSERQLAQQLGVSNATIGRVMHELQRAGIVQRVPGKGTYLRSDSRQIATFLEQVTPSKNGGAAKALAEKPAGGAAQPLPISKEAYTWIITSFKPEDRNDPSLRWSLRATSAIERVIQGAGGRTLLFNTQIQPTVDVAMLSNLVDRGINSVIIVSSRVMRDCPQLGYLLMEQQTNEKGWPIVQIPFGSERWPFNTVNYDEERGIYTAVSHLWNLGHREIVFVSPRITDAHSYDWLEQREESFQFALSALSGGKVRGSTLRVELPLDSFNADASWQETATSAARTFLNDGQYSKITAALLINDISAHTFLEEVRAAGKRVPEDLSVIGFDDHPWSSSLGLTTIHAPIEEMAEQAVQIVSRNLTSPSEHRVDLILAPPLIQRETTAPYVVTSNEP